MGGGRVAAVGAALWLVGLFAPGGGALAQGTARSLDLDTSVRSLGRGGAANAVFWDGGNEWANPALLGYRRGLSFAWERQELVPELADDVLLSSRRLSLGLWGVGFSTMGQPIDVIGGADLDYGSSEATDPEGNPVGSADSFEHIRAWSAGVSVAELLDHVTSLFGGRSSVADWADVAVGTSRKRVAMALYPPETHKADATDWGILARVTPLDTRRGTGGDAGATHRVELSFGHSMLNANDAMLDVGRFGRRYPTSRIKRDGGAIGWTMRAAPEAAGAGRRMARWLGPDRALVRVVVAADREHVSAGGDESAAYDVDRRGLDASFGRVLALRVGQVRDVEGDIDGFSWGLGFGAPLGPLAELAYDFASIPQAEGLGPRHAHAVTLRLDVLETLRTWREEGSHAN